MFATRRATTMRAQEALPDMTARPNPIVTPFTQLLGLDYPIVQAPIGSAACPALAAAVSEAGGLGMLAFTWSSPTEARSQIRATRARTQRPFGVNLVLAFYVEEILGACLDEGVDIVSLSWGEIGSRGRRIKTRGARLVVQVGSAAEARRAAAAGADAIVAQGWEAGGHVQSEVSTLALTPRVVDAVSPLPVLAAGAIADGRGIAAALALGASGAWIGTRFLATEESNAHSRYKQAIVDASEVDTFHGRLFDLGWQAAHRALDNSTHREWIAAGSPSPGSRPGEGEVLARDESGAPVFRYSDVIPRVGLAGDLEALAHYAGQGVGLVRRVQPAAEVVLELAEETNIALARLRTLGG